MVDSLITAHSRNLALKDVTTQCIIIMNQYINIVIASF